MLTFLTYAEFLKYQLPQALVYALVARGGTILAEFTDSTGNFTTVTQNILDCIPDKVTPSIASAMDDQSSGRVSHMLKICK